MKKLLLAAALPVLLLAACDSGGAPTPAGPGASEPGAEAPGVSAPSGVYVSGPLLVRPEPDTASPMMLITGPLVFDGTCMSIGGNPVVWPLGTTYDVGAAEVTTPGGGVIKLSEVVYSGGGSTAFDAIPTERFTGEALDLLESCLGPDRVVLDLHGPSTTPPS